MRPPIRLNTYIAVMTNTHAGKEAHAPVRFDLDSSYIQSAIERGLGKGPFNLRGLFDFSVMIN